MDLDNAINLTLKRFKHVKPSHPYHAVRLNNTGSYLQQRSEMSEAAREEDVQAAIYAYTEGWESEGAQLSLPVAMARDTAVLNAKRSVWPAANPLLQKAIKLLPQFSPNSMRTEDQQAVLRHFSGMASLTTAVAINAGKTPEKAPEPLEGCRGVIARLIEMRVDFYSLEGANYRFAEDLTAFWGILDSCLVSRGMWRKAGMVSHWR
ncbi:hypothetical protein DL765_006086 [Monosporascus sp. GIB2]|nr:hypothetical protein DL765_006086 [Monosporascus sp. GIB2]